MEQSDLHPGGQWHRRLYGLFQGTSCHAGSGGLAFGSLQSGLPDVQAQRLGAAIDQPLREPAWDGSRLGGP